MTEKRKRKTQQCIYCQNHGEDVIKKDHVCPYRDCECLLCDLLRQAQKTMRQQQRIWRDQKNILKQIYGTSFDFNSISGQVCDMCRNHLKLIYKKNHECPFINCGCDFCNLTRRRREMMKQLQRVRRCKIKAEINDDEEKLERDLCDEDADEETSNRNPAKEFSYKSENVEYIYDNSGILFPKKIESKIETKIKDNSDLITTKRCSPPPLIPLEICQFESIISNQEVFSNNLPIDPHYNISNNCSPPPLCLIDNINDIELEASAEQDNNMEDILTAVNRFAEEKRLLLREQLHLKERSNYDNLPLCCCSSTDNIISNNNVFIKEEPIDEPVYLPCHRENISAKNEDLKNPTFH
ncbi:hypothetical protein Avbf_04956 [Armadillidium vulgare]|nr:hypothetical protein Avbf_04956 [Armadillidium vulgare]